MYQAGPLDARSSSFTFVGSSHRWPGVRYDEYDQPRMPQKLADDHF